MKLNETWTFPLDCVGFRSDAGVFLGEEDLFLLGQNMSEVVGFGCFDILPLEVDDGQARCMAQFSPCSQRRLRQQGGEALRARRKQYCQMVLLMVHCCREMYKNFTESVKTFFVAKFRTALEESQQMRVRAAQEQPVRELQQGEYRVWNAGGKTVFVKGVLRFQEEEIHDVEGLSARKMSWNSVA